MAATFEKLAAALKHHQTGDLRAAETGYRQVLQTDPNQPDALHLLGVIAHQVGRHDAAIKCISRAIGENSSVAAFHGNVVMTPVAQIRGRLHDPMRGASPIGGPLG